MKADIQRLLGRPVLQSLLPARNQILRSTDAVLGMTAICLKADAWPANMNFSNRPRAVLVCREEGYPDFRRAMRLRSQISTPVTLSMATPKPAKVIASL